LNAGSFIHEGKVSFEVFMQCFDDGRPAGVAAEAVRGAFSHFAEDSELDYWHVCYDRANSSHIRVTRRGDQIEELTVHRPCGDERLWESIYRVLTLGPWVLYFPAPKPPLVMADRSTAEKLPRDMRKTLGPVREVHSGREILEIVESS
jgi:hypothetical protein